MKKNKEFVLICVVLFISAATLYGMISFYGSIETQITDLIKDSVFGGYCITAMFCGGYLFVNFIKNKNIIFKVASALLFPITVIGIISTGVFMLIPTVIMKLIEKDKNNDENA